MEISEVVNSFSSEAVQVKVVERLLDALVDMDKNDTDGEPAEIFAQKNVSGRGP